MQNKDLSQVFHSFSDLRIMVVGDVMVDAYLFGKVERISPEAPVPIVSVERRVNRLGGAANVALNLKSIGVTAVLCAVIGQDQKGEEFLQLLEDSSISGDAILRSPDRVTTTKFRIIGNNMQMLRVDEEMTQDLTEQEEEQLLETIQRAAVNNLVNAIILQDYNKGILTEKVIGSIIELAARMEIPVIVDPKRKNFGNYRDVTLFKPNLKELKEGLNMDLEPGKIDLLEKAADTLHDTQHVSMVMVTLSDKGVFISEQKKDGSRERHHVEAHRRSIADVSGAGDSVVSVAAACLAAGLQAKDIAFISNIAGGLVCEEVGVVPVNKEKLMEEVHRLSGS